MTEDEWLRELNLYMDHNDHWSRRELALFIAATERKNRRALLEQLNEGHPDGPWKESHETDLPRPKHS